jgi:hypothetical protein
MVSTHVHTGLEQTAFAAVLSRYQGSGLISATEADEVLACFADDYPFASAMGLADSFHVHIKVDDVSRLPHDEIVSFGGRAENAKDGYIKYAHGGGLNMIFSSIPVAEDDRLADASPRAKPFVDHMGIDLRREEPAVKAVFDAVPAAADALGWAHASQGGDRPVFCCHVEVSAKHWVYPGDGKPSVELAYGPLLVNAESMGCDLRPIDPRHAQAAEVGCCGKSDDPNDTN